MKKSIFLLAFALYCTTSWAVTVTWLPANGLWNNPANWDTGFVPTAVDDVVIPAGTQCGIPGGFFAEAKSVWIQQSKLVVATNGTLFVNNSNSDGILVQAGRLDNRGSISVINSTNNGISLIQNGKLRNQVEQLIDIQFSGDDGLWASTSNALILNLGDIFVNESANEGIECFGKFRVGPQGSVLIQNTGGNGFLMENNGLFENFGIVEINTDIGNHGFYVSTDGGNISYNRSGGTIDIFGTGDEGMIVEKETFVNEVDALIHIEDVGNVTGLGNGLYVGSIGFTGAFENYGTIELVDMVDGGSAGLRVYLEGVFENKNGGSVQIDNISGSGIAIVMTGQFINEEGGTVQMNVLDEHGIDISGDFTNFGMITIEETPETGLYFIGNSIGENYGTIQISDVGYSTITAFQHSFTVQANGTFKNRECGRIITDLDFAVGTTASLTNEGWIKSEGTGYNISGFFQNAGVVEDYEDGLNGQPVVNDAIIVREIPVALTVGVLSPNFLELGTLANHTVNGVYTDETLSTFAGAYAVASNSFNPNATAVGLTELFVRITDADGFCSETFKVSVPLGISLSGAPAEKSLEGELDGAAISVYPNPSNGQLVIEKPAGPATLIWTDMTGRTVHQLSTEAAKVMVELPGTMPTGLYQLLIQAGEAAPIRQSVVVQR